MRSLLKSGHESCEVILLFSPPLGMFENFLNYTFMFVFEVDLKGIFLFFLTENLLNFLPESEHSVRGLGPGGYSDLCVLRYRCFLFDTDISFLGDEYLKFHPMIEYQMFILEKNILRKAQ